MKMSNWRRYKGDAWSCVVAAFVFAVVYVPPAGGATTQNLGTVIQPVGANLDPVPTGSTVPYNVSVKNTGTAPQSNVLVQVRFSGGRWSAPVNGVGANCTFSGGKDLQSFLPGVPSTATLTCTAGQLAGGATRSFAVQVITPTSINGPSEQFTVTAVAVSSAGVGAFTSSVVTRVATLPDLDPEVIGPPTTTPGAVPPTVNTGVDAPYLVRVRNIGDGHASSVSSRITLPATTSFVRLEQNTFQSCSHTPSSTADEIVCSSLAGIPPGGEASVRVVVRPNPLAADGTSLLLSVNADPSNVLRERNETNNTTFSVRTLRRAADLKITGTLVFRNIYPAHALPLGITVMEARLKVKNLGPSTSPATTVQADWRGSLNPSSSCSLGFVFDFSVEDCVAGSPKYYFNSAPVPALAPDSSVDITLIATNVNRPLTNIVEFGTVTVDPNHLANDPNLQDNLLRLKP